MRARDGAEAMDDLLILTVAVIAFTLFFASLSGAYVAKEHAEGGRILGERADALLAAVMDDPRWTSDHGLFLAAALDGITDEDVAALTDAHGFLVVFWNLETDDRWEVGRGAGGEVRRTSSTSANIVGERVDPARVAVTVWP